MGGTTAKACLVEHGEPSLTNTFEVARIYRFKKGSGFPVSVPSVDLVEIGAGGGSLAHTDQFGLLKVGPSRPAPSRDRRRTVAAAPSRRSPTPTSCSGCSIPPPSSAATCRSTARRRPRRSTPWASALGLDTVQAAAGIHEIVNQNMAAAARMHAVEHGVDLRGVTVLAFGGAGPVHACGVAELLDSDRVMFPVNASVLSAFGTLVSPVRIDLARSMPRRLDAVDPAERDAMLDELRDRGPPGARRRRRLPDAVRFRYGLDARYAGQGNEVTVWVGEGEDWPPTTTPCRPPSRPSTARSSA